MFYEYAIDPAVISNPDRLMFYHAALGISKGRMLLRFPKQWRRDVCTAIGLNDPGRKGIGDVQAKRLKARIDAICSHASTSKKELQRRNELSWLENISQQFEQLGIEAIITETADADMPGVIAHDFLPEAESWKRARHSREFARNTQGAMVQTLAPLLKISSYVIIVDPHWGPENPRHRRVLEDLLAFSGQTSPAELRIGIVTKNTISPEALHDLCTEYLVARLPVGRPVFIKQFPSAEMHNRFIITDRGVVQLGDGIEINPNSRQTDNLIMLGGPEEKNERDKYVGDHFDDMSSGAYRVENKCP